LQNLSLSVYIYYIAFRFSYRYMNIAILWYGVEGKSTYAYLLKHGTNPENITILDGNPRTEIPVESMAQLWDGYLVWLESFDQIWRSPWFTRHHLSTQIDNPEKRAIIEPKLTSQTNYFFANYTGETIGVTGTKGKSTTVSFLLTLLSQWPKKVVLAGNIGTPVFDIIDLDEQPDIWYIDFAEWSSCKFSWDSG